MALAGLCVLACAGACGGSGSSGAATGNPASPGTGTGVTPGPSDGGADAATDASPGTTGYVPPLGASIEGGTLHLRARSVHATRLEVSLFKDDAAPAKLTVLLARAAGGDTWEASVPVADVRAAGIAGTILYGYRAWGPNWPYDASWTPGSAAGFVADADADNNRFNPNKLLIDPYARELSHDPSVPGGADGSVYGVGNHRTKDSAPLAPKSMVLPGDALDTGVAPPGAFKDDVVYEVHVRGLTRADASLGACAGTYAGAASKAAYLKALGVTAIELLPVQETQNDMNDVAASTAGDNYWGYSTLAYFAPDRRYACDKSPGGPTRELAALVKAMHDAGIKVFLDVVYNHTAEGGGASLLSLRGMDNASYYELTNDGGGYVDNTGIGANVNVKSDITQTLVLDSLTYFRRALGIDGFRFDLAAVLGNSCTRGCFNFDGNAKDGLLARAHAALPGVPLVAEPWGIGNGTYQLGNFPVGWSEWNGQFRDTVRAHQNQQGAAAVTAGAIANVIAGSQNLYAPGGVSTRGVTAPVNYLVSHDGFTLRDLYSCNAKNNGQPWPYGPSDGGDDNNHSWDHGGDDAAQRRATRTGLALLLVSTGVPMITGGDELYRTLECNNNSYNLDSEATWLDWTAVTREADHLLFTQRLLAFRRAHPALRPGAFWQGKDPDNNGLADVAWYRPDGAQADGAYLGATASAYLGFRLDGAPAGDPSPSIFVAYNGAAAATHVTLPGSSPGKGWYCSADTARAVNAFAAPGSEELAATGWDLGGRAVAIFIER
jgi:isoamylase